MAQNKFMLTLFKSRKWIYTVLALPVIAGVIYQLIYYYLYPLPYLAWPKFHVIVIPFAELFLLFASFDIYARNKEKQDSAIGWQLAFIFAVFNLVVIFILEAYYQARSDYTLVKMILSFVPALQGFLLLSMAVCFWMGFRKPLVRIWKTFSFATDKEATRKGTRLTLAILLGCFVAGLGLRLYNLGGFPPYVDEYPHMSTAIALLKGQPVEYGRAFLTVTLPVYLSYLIFGIGLWAARLPMVLINMLAIFPLYLLGRKINKGVGYIGVFLFVFSPWLIAAARIVRDYAVVPLVFYLAALWLVDLLDWDDLNFKAYLQKHIYRMALAVLILAYAIYDKNSILKIIIAMYGVFSLLAALKIWRNNPPRWLKITMLSLGAICILLLINYAGLVKYYFMGGILIYKVAFTFWSSLVDNSVRQWYMIKELGYAVLLIGSFFAVRAAFTRHNKNEFVLLFCYLVFAANLFYLTFFLVNPRVFEHPRYGVLMEYWYVLVVAIALFTGFQLFRGATGTRHPAVFILVAAALFFNVPAIRMVLSYQGGGPLEVTGENHYLVEPAHEYLVGHLTEKDVLVTDILQSYDGISGSRFPALKVLRFKGSDFAVSDPLEIVRQYPQGWIAVSLNSHPENTSLKFSDFDYANRHIRYIGLKGEIHIWQWEAATP